MRERYQNELAKRARNTLPFEDERLVSGLLRTIMDEMQKIRRGSGSIVFPEMVSSREERKVRRFLARHHPGLLGRIEGFLPIRLEEGIGTEILIRERRRI